MPISYLRFVQSHPVLLLERTGSLSEDCVVIFDPVLEENPSLSIGDRFRKIQSPLLDADLVIFRGSLAWQTQGGRSFKEILEGDPVVKVLLEGKRAMLLHAENPESTLSLHSLYGGESIDNPVLLEEIRTTEMLALIEHSGALLSDHEKHFALPSGFHANMFLAVDRLLADLTTVNRIADWILEELQGADAILTDQSSMIPLAQALRFLAAISSHQRRLPLRILGSYPAEITTMVKAVDDLVDRIGVKGKILFLLSVNSTERLVRYFRATAPRGSRIVSLCDTTEEPGADQDRRWLVHVPIQRFAISQGGECTLCVDGRILEGINPETFERSFVRKPKFILANRERLEKHSDFWMMVDKADACRLHYNDEHGRHHPIYLEIDRLVALPAFRERAIGSLRQIESPRLVIIPRHSRSEVVSDLVAEAFPSAHIEILDSNHIPDGLGPRLAGCGHVLIADDAIITTQTVSSLKLQAYRFCKHYGQSPRLDVFAVIVRPRSSEELKQLKNRLYDHQGIHLRCAQEVLMPYPGEEYCVLCQEQRLLQNLIDFLTPESREVARGRVQQLSGRILTPLMDFDGSERIQGSFVGDNLRKRTIFSATQSVAQEMVDEASKAESASEAAKIDANDLITKYFDAEILGAFLRSFNRRWLWWPGHEEKISSQLEHYPREEASVLSEIGWAAALGRLPAEPVLKLLSRRLDKPVIIMLRELIEVNVLGKRLSGLGQ